MDVAKKFNIIMLVLTVARDYITVSRLNSSLVAFTLHLGVLSNFTTINLKYLPGKHLTY